jgi:cobalt-zinc-cadmium efflux system membrane fusion protein
MNRLLTFEATICIGLGLLLTGCGRNVTAQENSAASAPPPATVVTGFDVTDIQVDHPEQFPLVAATERMAAPELNVTGVVSPDVSRQVPVPSLATGRVIEIDARLGDEVSKDQLLFKVRSTDVAGAYSDYRQAVKNEELTKVQLNRAQILYDHGAVPKSTLEVAQNGEHLRLMGLDPDHPTGIVAVYAPITGTITDQEITNQSGVQALSAPNPFTISDMSYVWIVCDVYENDIAGIHMGDAANIRLNAFPGQVFKGRVGNVGAILDPNIRTAKVRIEVPNAGMIMRLGMFATATFRSQKEEMHTQVPSAAILHLHDRDWVFLPAQGKFHRTEVTSGASLPNQMQEVLTGLRPGQQVVSNAGTLENAIENE